MALYSVVAQLIVGLSHAVDHHVQVVVVDAVHGLLVVGAGVIDHEAISQVGHALGQEGEAHPAAVVGHIVELAAGEGGQLTVAGVHCGGGSGVDGHTAQVHHHSGGVDAAAALGAGHSGSVLVVAGVGQVAVAADEACSCRQH